MLAYYGRKKYFCATEIFRDEVCGTSAADQKRPELVGRFWLSGRGRGRRTGGGRGRGDRALRLLLVRLEFRGANHQADGYLFVIGTFNEIVGARVGGQPVFFLEILAVGFEQGERQCRS